MLDKLIDAHRVVMDMKARTKDEALEELVGVLDLPEDKREILLVTLKKREAIGSTGVGQGIAIPHSRSLVVDRLEVVVGRSKQGVDFDAIDGKPVHLFFLIVAPPHDGSTGYLLTLGHIANLARKLARRKDWMDIEDAEAFREYLIQLAQEES